MKKVQTKCVTFRLQTTQFDTLKAWPWPRVSQVTSNVWPVTSVTLSRGNHSVSRYTGHKSRLIDNYWIEIGVL